MDGIGSENLELSFRIWICGGSIDIAPCSRVGHIGRRRKPYQKESDLEAVLRNKIRVAELWMGEYKWMFYRRTPKARTMLIPDLDKRRQLHDELQCGNFEWFMNEIYPDLHIVPYEDLILHGEIRCSSNEDWCLESNNIHGNPGSVVDVAPCHGVGKGQVCIISL
uniref:Polypeptide N-acetylgalactosaminyltransferase 4-like n=1 Tax=Phallusia mammillata TaxID=59560 RepID=A0A6F9DCQ9_9ASCI|nr:polypeptide N-acetylgalactosaminyltransferase 4-like [Phallusia mammillata]